MTVNVSVPAAVGVPVIAKLLVPLPGTVRPAIAPLNCSPPGVSMPVPPAGRDRLVVGHVHRVGRQVSSGEWLSPSIPP